MKQIIRKIIVGILRLEASLVLKRFKPKIIGVTGSVGKTTTKDVIFDVLNKKLKVRKNIKSYNSEFGAPLTILNLTTAWSNPLGWARNVLEGLYPVFLGNNYPDWLVLEMGVGEPNDMEGVVSLAKPNIGVFTGMAEVPVHVEFFKSPHEVLEEKRKMLKAIDPNGWAVLNRDDSLVYGSKEVTRAKIITFGFSEEADVVASDLKINYEGGNGAPAGMSFKVSHNDQTENFTLNGVLGKGQVYAALAGICVGLINELKLEEMVPSIADVQFTPSRMNILPGIKNTTIIDDSYNASPVAVELALNTLNEIENSNRKMIVLGGMAELGKFSSEAHYEIGRKIAEVKDLELIILSGSLAHGYERGLLKAQFDESKILKTKDALDAGRYLQNFINEKDIVLIKGSQSARTELAVLEIMAEPDLAKSLVVRQEDYWKT